MSDPVTDAEREVVGRAARAGAARPRGGRAPLPVRAARRRRDLAAAGDGTPFPTLYYLTCPRATSAVEPARGGRADAGDGGAAGHRRRPRGRVPSRARGLPRHAGTRSATCCRRSPACTRRRHARPGQVPARPRRARARRRSGREPVRRRGARGLGEWWAAGPCALPARGRRDPGRRDRLRHQLDPAARRRRRPARARSSTCTGGWRSCGSARAWTDRPAGARGAWSAPASCCAEYAGAGPRRSAPSGCGWSPPAPPATPRTAPSSWRWCVAMLGVEPEVVSGDEEARLSFTGATASLDAARGRTARSRPAAVPGGRHRRRLDRVRARRPRPGCGPRRSVDIGCVRMTERHLHADPPTAARDRRREADIRAALADVRRGRAGRRGRDAGRAWPARSRRWPRSRSGCPRTTRARSTTRGSPRRGRARSPPTCWPRHAEPGGDAGHAPRPGRRDRRRGARPAA